MTDAMISYSRRDLEFVQKLHGRLAALGKDIWVDWEDIPKTAEWWDEIKDGIEKAENFVYIISPDSVASEVCGWEINHALDIKKRLIPVLLKEVTDPETKAKMRDEVNSHNWIFARDGQDDFDSVVEQVVKAMETDLDHIRTHTRLLVRGLEWDKADRDKSLLLIGNDLTSAEKWLENSKKKNSQPAPDAMHVSYVNASREEANRKRRVFFIMTAVVLVVVGLGLFAGYQAIVANQQREIAERAENQAKALALASNALVNLDAKKLDLAIALAIRANSDQTNRSTATIRALSSVGYAPGTRALISVESPITGSAFSSNGKYAYIGSEDGVIRKYNMETGKLINTYEGHKSAIWGIEVGPNEEYMVSGSEDKEIIIWDLETGEIKHELSSHHIAPIWDVTINPEKGLVAAASADSSISLWDIETGEYIRSFNDHMRPVWTVRFSPDGTQLLSGGEDDIAILWDVETGEVLHKLAKHEGTVTDVAFHPTKHVVYTVSEDMQVISWDLSRENVIDTRIISQPGDHTEGIVSIAVSPDGKYLLSGSQDNKVILWNLNTNQIRNEFLGHLGTVNTLRFDNTGERFISGGQDGVLRLWDVNNGAQIYSYQGKRGDAWSVAISPDGEYIISNNDMELIDAATGAVVREIKLSDTDIAGNVAFSPSGSRIVSAMEGGNVVIWDTATGDELYRFKGHSKDSWMALFTNDGTQVISGSDDTTMYRWDAETGKIIQEYIGHKGSAWTGALSPDGTLIATASDAGELYLWDVETGELLRSFDTIGKDFNQFETELEIYEVTFSSDGKYIATGDTNNLVNVWDVETGERIARLDGHAGLVSTVAFSSDDTTLVSGGYDNEIIMWDIEQGVELRRFSGHEFVVTDANISPDGHTIVSGTANGNLRVWYVHTPEELADWVLNNRYVREITCFEKQVYSIEDPDDNCELKEGELLEVQAAPQAPAIRDRPSLPGLSSSANSNPDSETEE